MSKIILHSPVFILGSLAVLVVVGLVFSGMAVAQTGTPTKIGSCVLPSGECANNVTDSACRQQSGKFTENKVCRLTFTPNVPIPRLFEGTQDVDESLFGRYVNRFYIFFSGVAGILAVVMMMWGGFHYITSGGSPQRMAQGKEIISNAVIGLILLLTAYLLLNTINPRLTKLRIPTIAHVPEILQRGYYCEAQGALAMAEAKKQNALCGSEVKYKNEDGKEQTCVSLAIDDKYKPLVNHIDQEIACFIQAKFVTENGQTRSQIIAEADTKARDLCDKEEFTPGTQCDKTHAIFKYQSIAAAPDRWLTGTCKKAIMVADKCVYKRFLNCPPTTQRVACNDGGGQDTGCWSNGRPAKTTFGSITSTCTDSNSLDNPPIEEVDSICCKNDAKEAIECADKPNPSNKLQVDCGPYNGDPVKFFQDGVTRTCQKKCWQALFLATSCQTYNTCPPI